MAHVVIIGAGPMGLSAAWFAQQTGHRVTVVEADKEAGGMAAHFDFNGVSLEKFYHFCCRNDHDTLSMLSELDMDEAMQWKTTTMGYFVDNALYRFGDPISLLRFSPLSFLERFRYGLMAFTSTRRSDWTKLDLISAKEWITRWCGERVYQKLWHPLLSLKFYEYTDEISAAWVWQRIQRLGSSRQSLFEEQLGYIKGGSQTLINELVSKIQKNGGSLHLDNGVAHIRSTDNVVNGIELSDGRYLSADIVLSTIPLPHITRILSRELPALAQIYESFSNVGVVCVIHKLKKSVSPHFWVNVADPDMQIPGFVEFSNLRELPDTVVYVPYYMPADNPLFLRTDEEFLEESFAYLQKVNPELESLDRLDGKVSRLQHAQPVCNVGFSARIPDTQTDVKNLWIADTSFYYPEDRGVSESIRFARKLIERINEEPA